MKLCKEVKITNTKTEIVSIQCDKCGSVSKGQSEILYSDITSHELSFGFGSKFDSEVWHFDLCDDCVEDITKDFKDKIKKTGYDI